MPKEYPLSTPLAKEQPSARQYIAPPRPGKGERGPRPYSDDDLDGLYATSHSIDWQCMVTLKPPPTRRIITAKALESFVMKTKDMLANQRRRNGLPSALFVTEFDRCENDGESVDAAGFHIGFSQELTEAQQEHLLHWWLSEMGLANNQGRSFQYDADGGGPNLQKYLAKDIDFRFSPHRFVKFPPSWLPTRLTFRLWFIVGGFRRSAAEGRALKARTGFIRKRFEGAHGNEPTPTLKASTDKHEGEHGQA